MSQLTRLTVAESMTVLPSSRIFTVCCMARCSEDGAIQHTSLIASERSVWPKTLTCAVGSRIELFHLHHKLHGVLNLRFRRSHGSERIEFSPFDRAIGAMQQQPHAVPGALDLHLDETL